MAGPPPARRRRRPASGPVTGERIRRTGDDCGARARQRRLGRMAFLAGVEADGAESCRRWPRACCWLLRWRHLQDRRAGRGSVGSGRRAVTSASEDPGGGARPRTRPRPGDQRRARARQRTGQQPDASASSPTVPPHSRRTPASRSRSSTSAPSRRSGWDLLLGVARGSVEPPRFVVMRHTPPGRAERTGPRRWSARASPSTPAASRSSRPTTWTG